MFRIPFNKLEQRDTLGMDEKMPDQKTVGYMLVFWIKGHLPQRATFALEVDEGKNSPWKEKWIAPSLFSFGFQHSVMLLALFFDFLQTRPLP